MEAYMKLEDPHFRYSVGKTNLNPEKITIPSEPVPSYSLQSITSSDKFVPRGILPEIESTLPVRSVFAILAQQNIDGFILTHFGEANRYVLGATLAEAFVNQAKSSPLGMEKAIAQLADTPVGQWLSAPSVRSFPIEERGPAPSTIEELENGPDTVFLIGARSLQSGYFMNHETVRYAATGRVVWVCGNPSGRHDNGDPDHGSCGFCPFPIDHCEVR
jgi:hypothetical protein